MRHHSFESGRGLPQSKTWRLLCCLGEGLHNLRLLIYQGQLTALDELIRADRYDVRVLDKGMRGLPIYRSSAGSARA